MFCDLQCQFLCWCQDQSAGFIAGRILDFHKDGQQIGGCFSRSGLRDPYDFLSAKDQRNGFLLNLGRFFKAGVVKRVQKLLVEIELIE